MKSSNRKGKIGFASYRKYLLITLVVCFSAQSYAQQAGFRADLKNSGYYSSDNQNFTRLKWKFKTNGVIYSSPIVASGHVFFGSQDSCIYAVDTASGNLHWKFKTGGVVPSTPIIKDSVLYTLSMDARFYAININNGEAMWNFETEGEMQRTEQGLFNKIPLDSTWSDPWDFYLSSAKIVDTVIYFGSSDHHLYALNANTGEMIWKYEAGKSIHTTPAYDEGRLFFGSWDSKIYAIDALSGEEIWTYQTGIDSNGGGLMEGIQGSPAVSNGVVYCGSRDSKIYALNATNGSEIWLSTFGSSWMPASPAVDNENIYMGTSGPQDIFFVDKDTGEPIHQSGINHYYFSSPAITDEQLYVGSFNGQLYSFNKESGATNWEFQPPLSVQNHLNLTNPNGSFNVNPLLNMFDYSQVSADRLYLGEVFKLGSIVSSPVLDQGMIYFTSTDSCLYALEGATLTLSGTDLGTQEENSIVDFELVVSVEGGSYDSTTVAVKDNRSSVRNAVIVDPVDLQPVNGQPLTIPLKINTESLGIGEKQIMLYLDFWQDGHRNRAVAPISMTIVEPQPEPSITGIGAGIPKETATLNCYPNPFSHSLSLEYTLKRPGRTRISVVNMAGAEIISLEQDFQKNGEYKVLLNGGFPTGIYMVRLVHPDGNASQKVVSVN